MVGKILTSVGLVMTIVGATLLFVYALPKKIEGVIIWGPLALGAGESADSPGPAATSHYNRAWMCSKLGFGLVGAGTVLQLVAVWL